MPYYLGDRPRQGSDPGAALLYQRRAAAGRRIPAALRQRHARRDRQHQLQQCPVGNRHASQRPQWRGHINATGVWDLDETYRTGFDLQRVSDQTYLLRFGFGNAAAERDDQPRLSRRLRAARLDRRLRLRCFSRCCRASATRRSRSCCRSPTAPGSANPIALGGRWFLNGNLLNIVREVGTQTRRLSLGSRWDRIFRDGIGGQYTFSASVRGDAYSVNDLSADLQPRSAERLFPAQRHAGSRADQPQLCRRRAAFPQLGLTWSYPLAHRGPERTAIVEPIVGAYAAPAGGNRRRIPNEDSLGFELHDTDLFRPDRLAGYDLLDTGQRVDYGLKLGLYDKAGGNYRLLIGQSYRAQPNPFLPPGSGADRAPVRCGRTGRRLAQFLSRPDLSLPPRQEQSAAATRRSASAPVRKTCGSARNFLYRPPQLQNEVVTNPATGQTVHLRQARAALVQRQNAADPLLVAGRQPRPST